MERMICALFGDRQAADRAIGMLLESGMDKDLISVILHEGTLHHEDIDSPGTEVRRRAVEGAALGGVAGAVLGALVFGPFGLIGLGPLAAALTAGGAGGFYGAIAGALTGRDTDKAGLEQMAKAVEEDGKILLTVDVSNTPAAEKLREQLRNIGAEAAHIV